MSVHPPIVRRYVPPSDAERAASRADARRLRDEFAAKRAADRPARRQAILAGPSLRDVDAATDCHCGCHPRPAQDDLHDGGRTCGCQLTDAERAAQRESLFASLAELSDDTSGPDSPWAKQRAEFDAEAVALGVEARIAVSGAPFVIVGTCDGRGFYLRERHGSYRVTIAADHDPAADPWGADVTETSIDIAGGEEWDFIVDGDFSAARALQIAVDAVRTALTRNGCGHEHAGGASFCPTCGAPMADAQAWHWDTEADAGE